MAGLQFGGEYLLLKTWHSASAFIIDFLYYKRWQEPLCRMMKLGMSYFFFLSLHSMKSVFKIVLLTLISCCYLNTVFEFSDTEKKTNFENETHTYIQQDNHNLNVTYTKTVKQIDNEIISWQTENTFPYVINDAFSFTKVKNFSPPPERRYILYASLLI